ncbi:MAG: endonuclease III [bacterium]|nr:endonuclease III [bacterium]
MIKEENIEKYLDELIPNPKCELNFNKDYELLIAVMLSAQTTDKRVNFVTSKLFNKYPSLKKLKDADINDIEDIIRELGNYKKKSLGVKKIATELYEKYDGKVPNNREILESLPMVGRKTTNVVLSVLFNEPNFAVDTHVFRVSKRLKLATEKDDVLKVEEKLKKHFNKNSWSKLHHQFVLFGRYYCTARNPKCDNCKLKEYCKYEK